MNETLEQARERYQASLKESSNSRLAKAMNQLASSNRPLPMGYAEEDDFTPVVVNGKKKLVPTATKRTSPPRKDIPSQRVKPDVVEEGMEEEAPMTEAQKKFVEGLKAGADCYTTQVDGGRLVRSQKSEGDTTSAPGADEGKPAPKKMADLLKEAKAKFAENIINNSAPSPGSFPQAKATFAEGLKNHCNKGK